ncbi:MAG: hypothetical protein WC998_09165 [Candidatus Paceibacterota bacterium]|jgi:hypothetical protein
MNSQDMIKNIIDLRRSKWDKEHSKEKEGFFVFDPVPDSKVYLKRTDYSDASIRPDYVMFFISEEEDDPRSGMMYWSSKYQATPIIAGVDPFWPEGMKPNSEGHYVYIDSILVKVPLMIWLDKVKEDRGKYDKAADNLHKSFRAEADGAGAGMTDKELGF